MHVWLLSWFLSPCRDRATAHRTIRRQDKKIKDLGQSVEDERKQAENYKAEVSLTKHRVLFGQGANGNVQGGQQSVLLENIQCVCFVPCSLTRLLLACEPSRGTWKNL